MRLIITYQARRVLARMTALVLMAIAVVMLVGR
jgi:hypothetical protein